MRQEERDSDMKVIESNEALEMLRTVVKGRENFIYPREWKRKFSPSENCVYFTGKTPRCIIGNALHKWGFGVIYEENRAGELNGFVDGDVKFTDRALDILEAAQHRQDTNYTWGDALAAAEERAIDSSLLDFVSDGPIERRFNW